jgi:DNA-binding LacI/PurR family transcriptional regulator
MPKVKLQDVADYAHVSKATVSRVLNNHPTVASDIRDRVLDAVQILDYYPDRSARRLRKGTRDVIGVVISDIQNSYFQSVIRGVEDAAYAHQMHIVLCNTDEDTSRLNTYLRLLQEENVAGLIVSVTDAEHLELLHALQQNGTPIILIDRLIEGGSMDGVRVDNVDGARQAVQHLLHLDWQRIGILYPPVITGHERLQGYQAALNAAGITPDERLMRVGGYRVESAYQATIELLAAAPDAIFAANSMISLGALRALRERGLRVPQEVALVGFDDMPWAQDLYVPLTTVAQPTYEIGQEAVRLLLRRISHPEAAFLTVTLRTRLVVRESCGIFLRESA